MVLREPTIRSGSAEERREALVAYAGPVTLALFVTPTFHWLTESAIAALIIGAVLIDGAVRSRPAGPAVTESARRTILVSPALGKFCAEFTEADKTWFAVSVGLTLYLETAQPYDWIADLACRTVV